MNLLQAGKLDAMFVTVHGEITVEDYFKEQLNNTDVEIDYLATDSDMFFGISDKYLPGRDEAEFKDFKDFTIAIPFPITPDLEDTKAIRTFEAMANQSGFKLKTNVYGWIR